MLVIRFARVGKKNRAQFQIVLQEHTIAPGGRHVEVLGSYNPHSKATVLKEERIKYWISKGAQASPTVHNLLVSKKVVSGKKVVVKVPKKKVESSQSSADVNAGKETKTEEPKVEAKAGEARPAEETKEPKKEKTEEVKEEKAEEKKEEEKEIK